MKFRLPALESTSIAASQISIAIIQAASSDNFPGWSSEINIQELQSSPFLKETIEYTSTFCLAWIAVGIYYKLYDSEITTVRFGDIIDQTNRQMIGTANLTILLVLTLCFVQHTPFPVDQYMLHLTSAYAFNLLLRVAYFNAGFF
jgi:hypothetical protein